MFSHRNPMVADMQRLSVLNRTEPDPIRSPLRVLLCGPDDTSGPLAQRLTALGVAVHPLAELFTALAEVIDDPADYCALVLDCDAPGIGGLAGGRRAVQMLGEVRGRIPVILLCHDCQSPSFPLDRMAPVELPPAALRAGLAHALHDRLSHLTA